MNPLEFPNSFKLVESVRVRDTGVLLIIMIVVTAVGLLANARFLAPRYLPFVRSALAGIYVASLVLMFVIMIAGIMP